MSTHPVASNPARAAVDALPGPTLLEFGTPWCPHCQGLQPLLAAARSALAVPGLRHISIEDGRGQPLGRSFQVKLWPTLIFLHNGEEVTRLVRPDHEAVIVDALRRLL